QAHAGDHVGQHRRKKDLGEDLPLGEVQHARHVQVVLRDLAHADRGIDDHRPQAADEDEDRKSTRLNSSRLVISYAVFCLKKKNKELAANVLVKTLLTSPSRAQDLSLGALPGYLRESPLLPLPNPSAFAHIIPTSDRVSFL